MNRQFDFIAEQADAGLRIDVFCTQKIPDLSRSYAAQLLEEGNVLCNGQPARKNRKLQAGDAVKVTLPPPKEYGLKAENIALSLLYEDDCLAVVNKPPGMVVHVGSGHTEGTLVNALLYRLGSLSSINGEQRPGIVHRLDKDTSGVMVVAKNDLAHRELSRQFKERDCEKIYWALCEGRFTKEAGRIENLIGRDPKNRQRMAVVPGGRRAVTEYKVLEQFPSCALVECRLFTGRTHQIRVHMRELSHPCLGDPVYGLKKSAFPLTGQALHARTLGFYHPVTKEFVRFTAPLWADFDETLKKLQSHYTEGREDYVEKQ